MDGIIEEVDEDGSGTLDFDGNYYCNNVMIRLLLMLLHFIEFMEMMTG